MPTHGNSIPPIVASVERYYLSRLDHPGWTHHVVNPTNGLPSREDSRSHMVGPHVRMPYNTLPELQ